MSTLLFVRNSSTFLRKDPNIPLSFVLAKLSKISMSPFQLLTMIILNQISTVFQLNYRKYDPKKWAPSTPGYQNQKYLSILCRAW